MMEISNKNSHILPPENIRDSVAGKSCASSTYNNSASIDIDGRFDRVII